MPVKRSHKKSRYGCTRCRARRVKCDEVRPKCSTCQKRNEHCDYNRHSISYACDDKSESSLDVLSASVSPERTIVYFPTDAWRPDTSSGPNELELMHYWCTRTCETVMPKCVETCKESIPREAIRHSYLMDALLAVTSLHVATDSQDAATAPQYVSAALHYQTRSATSLNRMLGAITEDNCSAVFMTSILVMVSSIISPQFPAGTGDKVRSTTDIMVPIVHFLDGIKQIVCQSREWLLQGPFREWVGEEPAVDPKTDVSLLKRCVGLIDETILADMDKTSTTYYTFDMSVRGLEIAFRKGRTMLFWLSMNAPGFLDQVHEGDKDALAIFMCWGVLLDHLDRSWWAQYSGKRLVAESAMILETSGDKWKPVVDWCRETMGLPDQAGDYKVESVQSLD